MNFCPVGVFGFPLSRKLPNASFGRFQKRRKLQLVKVSGPVSPKEGCRPVKERPLLSLCSSKSMASSFGGRAGCRQPDLNSKGAESRREFDKPMAEDESAAAHDCLKFVESNFGDSRGRGAKKGRTQFA